MAKHIDPTSLRQEIAGKTYLRAPVAYGLSGGSVDRENKVIRNCAVLTRGEALGWYMWIDREMLSQVVKIGNEYARGLKSRFTHPSFIADGLGTFLGRVRNLRLDGDIVRGDLHLSDVAKKSPSGDLATYVLDLADEDPEAFGLSIVFKHDWGAEEKFWFAHLDKNSNFQSPDPDNVNNYMHARVSALRAVDAVDTPAANPGGMLAADNEFNERFEGVMRYGFELSDIMPSVFSGGVTPEHIRSACRAFMARHREDLLTALGVDADEEDTCMTKCAKCGHEYETDGACPECGEMPVGVTQPDLSAAETPAEASAPAFTAQAAEASDETQASAADEATTADPAPATETAPTQEPTNWAEFERAAGLALFRKNVDEANAVIALLGLTPERAQLAAAVLDLAGFGAPKAQAANADAPAVAPASPTVTFTAPPLDEKKVVSMFSALLDERLVELVGQFPNH